MRSESIAKKKKSPTGLSDADHSTNPQTRTTPDAKNYP
ncbi:hypothetical protein AB48_5308 [Escherichia coli 3-475-03_S1_C2]|nr:hypothetical protein AB48_5308 [Escherichia coli 3-475-03_S1_C2]